MFTCYSPVCRFTRGLPLFHARLACIRHAASVRSEPGSNSPLEFINPSLLYSRITENRSHTSKFSKSRCRVVFRHFQNILFAASNVKFLTFFKLLPGTISLSSSELFQISQKKILGISTPCNFFCLKFNFFFIPSKLAIFRHFLSVQSASRLPQILHFRRHCRQSARIFLPMAFFACMQPIFAPSDSLSDL